MALRTHVAGGSYWCLPSCLKSSSPVLVRAQCGGGVDDNVLETGKLRCSGEAMFSYKPGPFAQVGSACL